MGCHPAVQDEGIGLRENDIGGVGARAADVYTVTVTAFDGTISSSVQFHWTVNDTTPPALTQPADQASNEGQVVTGLQIVAKMMSAMIVASPCNHDRATRTIALRNSLPCQR